MKKYTLKIFSLLFFLSIIALLCKNQLCHARPEGVPIIHFAETEHIFPTVFEGKKLTHTFTVSNKGNKKLNIKGVTPS